MAMLSAERSKPRYVIHSSKLNAKWAEDENNMGRRLIAKMGWKPGEGLGANGHGRVDPLHVKYKCDTKGLGCNFASEKDIAVGQQQDFDALLATLSTGNENAQEESHIVNVEMNSAQERSTTSLELRSQKSRSRVHYHKFTRGKDLSRASSKDLASILGVAETSVPKVVVPDVKPDVGPALQFKLLESSGSSVDYFAQKIKKKKMNGQFTEESNNTKEKDDSNSENEVSGGTSGLDDTLSQSTPQGRRKSVTWGEVEVSFVSKYIKDMVDTSTESVNADSAEFVNSAEGAEETSDNLNQKKKKKKRKEKEENMSVEALESHEIDLDDKPLDNQKKKRKIKEVEENEISESLNQEDSNCNMKKKKKSKTRIASDGCELPEEVGGYCLDVVVSAPEEVEANELASSTPLKKKHKKKKVGTEDVQDEILAVPAEEISVADEAPRKKHKKKSKDKLKNFDAPSLGEHLNEDTSVNNADIDLSTTSKKKKKKIKNLVVEDGIILVNDIEESNVSEVSTEQKKKKKRKVSEVEENCSDREVKDERLNDTPVKKKKKKRDKGEIEDILDSAINDNSKEKKNKRKSEEDTVTEAVKGSVSEPSNGPTLSALTQERMGKWKERRKNVKEEKKRTFPIRTDTSDLLVQDYSYRKVLATLGCNVGSNKNVTIEMPPSNFPGSNLDSIEGYGKRK